MKKMMRRIQCMVSGDLEFRSHVLFREFNPAPHTKIWLTPPTVIAAFAVPKWRPVARTGRSQFHSETFLSPGESHFYRLHDPPRNFRSDTAKNESMEGFCFVFYGTKKRSSLEHVHYYSPFPRTKKARGNVPRRGLTIETVGGEGVGIKGALDQVKIDDQ